MEFSTLFCPALSGNVLYLDELALSKSPFRNFWKTLLVECGGCGPVVCCCGGGVSAGDNLLLSVNHNAML